MHIRTRIAAWRAPTRTGAAGAAFFLVCRFFCLFTFFAVPLDVPTTSKCIQLNSTYEDCVAVTVSMSTYEGCCCTYDLKHSPSRLLLLLLIVDQLVYRAVLLLCHIDHPAHAFYEVFTVKKMKNVSCEYDWLNGWNSTLQATWYIGHVRWACLFYNNTPEYWKTSAVSTTDRWLKLNFASCLFYNSFI